MTGGTNSQPIQALISSHSSSPLRVIKDLSLRKVFLRVVLEYYSQGPSKNTLQRSVSLNSGVSLTSGTLYQVVEVAGDLEVAEVLVEVV